MHSLKVLGFEIYYLIFYFIIFSFLGWAMETIRVSIRSKHFVNRGFANGPYCPIYGFGMLFIILFLSGLKNNFVLLFFGGMILATTLEYITAYLLETIFKAKWWDYSYKKFNYKGRICLDISIAWGILSLLMIEFIVPWFDILILSIPRNIGVIFIDCFLGFMTCDVIFTAHSLLSLNKILTTISTATNDIRLELSEYLDEISDTLKEHLRTEEYREKFENALKSYIKYKNKYKNDIMDSLNNIFDENIKIDEILDKFHTKEKLLLLREKYHNAYKNNKVNFVHKRIIEAFPKFKYKDINKDKVLINIREMLDKRIKNKDNEQKEQ